MATNLNTIRSIVNGNSITEADLLDCANEIRARDGGERAELTAEDIAEICCMPVTDAITPVVVRACQP
ncbi:MAG: hypothetical protein ABFD89_17820 [Bryobacteraceae bacterium]